ncbi:unnamed protein product [Clonostachys solani]|uniref:Zn(2)-C6 fungal-type domain-containing protein n=1 Tax=Clonostachys solani TaxID=160281 RepID=A0A9P0ELM6_9HYPO|nr:unnamed protein product [Clonostachys solani]
MSHPPPSNKPNELTFVLVDGQQPPQRKAAPKLYHKKSKTGCQLCRTRRVKCNEAKPTCHHCQRLGQLCVYDRQAPGGSPSTDKEEETVGTESAVVVDEGAPNDRHYRHGSGIFKRESEERRRLELKLLTHYFTETGRSIAVDEEGNHFWVNVICSMASESDALLYAIYVLSTLHLNRKGQFPGAEPEVVRAYLSIALQLHQKDISEISKSNCDHVCMTSNILRVYSFAELQDRPLDPYEPPSEWLRMVESSSSVFAKAWDFYKDGGNPEPVAVKMVKTLSNSLRSAGRRAKREHFAYLMSRKSECEMQESWDNRDVEAYEATVMFLEGVWSSYCDKLEPRSSIGRNVACFPMLVHKCFVEKVEERQPRALVMLAHYFALLTILREAWWIGDVGQREVYAIFNAVPSAWRSHLTWPMQFVNKEKESEGGSRLWG